MSCLRELKEGICMSVEGDMYKDEEYYRKQKDLEEHGVLVDGRDLVRLNELLNALAIVTGTTATHDHLRWTYDLRQAARAYKYNQSHKTAISLLNNEEEVL